MNFEQLDRESLHEGVFDILPQVVKDATIAEKQRSFEKGQNMIDYERLRAEEAERVEYRGCQAI
ncbi:hypothetical protein K7432_017525 [Basidiobolus ranarum]|uniref:Uncharacterized protein n=1 Tax=Basidiobolus ranarum TaxID=34480 RepID=A0ABR2VK99_9FUNG